MLSFHTIAHTVTGIPELQLSETEAAEIAKAAADVASYYPTDLLSDKTIAWANFVQAVAVIYGTRAASIFFRTRSAPQNRPQQTPRAMAPETANGHAPSEPPKPVPPEARRGEIPGVGEVEFPPNHPLAGGNRRH